MLDWGIISTDISLQCTVTFCTTAVLVRSHRPLLYLSLSVSLPFLFSYSYFLVNLFSSAVLFLRKYGKRE